MTRESLKKVFEEFGESEVKEERGRFVVIVVSPSFETMDEGERQSLVWQHALDRLKSEGASEIEFIFTYSPSEKAKLDRGEALPELTD